jgi:biopolymer transport protein ExbB
VKTLSCLAALALGAAPLLAADNFADAVKRAEGDYNGRLAAAADELSAARTRITDEKAPLLADLRAAEDRIIDVTSQMSHLRAGAENFADRKRKLLIDLDAVRKNTTYMSTLAHDGLTSFQEGLLPGESQALSEAVDAVSGKIDAAAPVSGQAAVDAAAYLLDRTERELGGYSAPGRSLMAGGNLVVDGTFAFVGPEAYFLGSQGGAAGVVRPRAGSAYPVTYSVAAWRAEDGAQFFQGRMAPVAADATGGKALRLSETRGTLLEHIKKGGTVAYAIIGVGCLSLLMILQKVRDLAHLRADPQSAVGPILEKVARGDLKGAREAAKGLQTTARELFETGLDHCGDSREILEEHLQSVLLEQRLHFERRLQLLAVIATAAPLMGLLGTVVGMVKTFALITVFGTGNAGKLASGISEVLVATELGLVVAIPTLIAHGFIAQRIQKNLSLLERYALNFVTAAESARLTSPSP